MTKDGRSLPVEVSTRVLELDGKRLLFSLVRDITERKWSEAALLRLNRELRAISKCNQALIRAEDEQSLLDEICRTICEDIGYRLAWVGYAEQDTGKTLRPIAWAGLDNGYIANARLSWSETSEHGRGPAGMVVRSGKPFYVQDLAVDSHMAPWREAALQRGYRSGIALPLKSETGGVFGVLMIYAEQPNAMTPVEVRLLEELSGDLAYGIVVLRNRVERKQAEQELLRINRFLHTLSRCNETLVHAQDEQSLLRDMCRVVVEAGDFALAWIGYVSAHTLCMQTSAGKGAEDYLDDVARLDAKSEQQACRPAVRAVDTGEIQVVQETAADSCRPWRERALAFGYLSAISLPLHSGEGVIGTLSIYAAEPNGFGEAEVALLSELADDLAYGIQALRARIERERFVIQLQGSMESTIQALASTVELRDPYTAGHQRRVARLAAEVARAAGYAEEQVQIVYLAGLVHDIGKISVPAEILSRPARLSVTEMALVRTHVKAGYEILKGIPFPWPIADIVHQHHERLDGSGYPNGLRGDEILLEARILSVCDMVEAMVTHRPYRPALDIDAALAEIQKEKGIALDAEIVDLCTKLFREQGFVLE